MINRKYKITLALIEDWELNYAKHQLKIWK